MSQYWKYRHSVLRLYKSILKQHKSLPLGLQELGNRYVREEFKLHKDLPPNGDEARKFLLNWKDYKKTLQDQLKLGFDQQPAIGRDLNENELRVLDQDQKKQLNKLKEEVDNLFDPKIHN